MTATVVEIDIPRCSRTYGVAPCSAAIGVTGTKKCFNVIRTCQDRANFSEGTPLTLRFCMPVTAGEDQFTLNGAPVPAIPSIKTVSVTPAVVNPGVDIGSRESVRVTFSEHPHSDAGVDPYLSDRSYDPFRQGTFWAKLRARIPSMQGYAFRVLDGDGTELTDFTTRHYSVDSVSGQGSEDVSLVAKDVLILTDDKNAQAPRISNGVLSADLAAGAGSCTLEPAGIGDAEYPASGKVAIGGKEICAFTRSGDVLTLTTRGDSGTEDEAHDEGDSVQLVLIFSAAEPADIVETLLVDYTPGFDAAWVNSAEWQQEVDDYIDHLYSAEIAEPTPVVTLLNELIEQIGLVFFWDSVARQVRLRSLRPVTAQAVTYSEDELMSATFRTKDQPQKRISEVWTYYGVRNPLEPLDEQRNFQAAIATPDANASLDYQQPAIKKIFSRWISANNRPAAQRTNAVLLSRYRDPPRQFTFSLYETIEEAPELGAGFLADHWSLQDDEGARVLVPAQVTSLERRADSYVIDAQEAIFVEQEELTGAKVVYIDQNQYPVNLRTLYDSIYSAPQPYDEIRFVVTAGILAGSVVVGSWPALVEITLVVNGSVLGAGGEGGSVFGTTGANGGAGLYTRYPVSVDNQGAIGGGGGGGAGAAVEIISEFDTTSGGGGGGGAGYPGGAGGFGYTSGGSIVSSSNGQPGTASAGGAGGIGPPNGGAGGNVGQSGNVSAHPTLPGTPGSAGAAVDGDSYITWINLGTIHGARIN